MAELVKKLPDIERAVSTGGLEEYDDPHRKYKAGGAELRSLRSMLDKKDEDRVWGGLEKKSTPEGHYLWLCKKHASKYD